MENDPSQPPVSQNPPSQQPTYPTGLKPALSPQSEPPPAPIQNQPPQKSKLSKWVKIFSFVFWIPFILLSLIFLYLAYEQSQGVSGTEFVGILLTPFVLGVAVIGLVYLVLLIVFLFRARPNRKRRVLTILAILFLVSLYGWQITVAVLQTRQINRSNEPLSDAEIISLIDSCTAESVQKDGDKVNLLLKSEAYYDAKGNYLWRSTTGSAASWDKFVAEVEKVKDKCGDGVSAFDSQSEPTYSWISVEQATELLQQCKIKTFSYTPSASDGVEQPVSGTPTGIILTNSTTINHLYVEPEQEATMIPVARNVQPSCDGPQFYHDDRYEQQDSSGAWQ